MYTITNDNILRDDGAVIPLVRGNIDYESFLVWQQAGNIANIFDTFPSLKASEIAAFLLTREDKIGRLVGIAVAAQAGGFPAIVSAAITARQALLDMLTLPSITSATTIGDLRNAIKQEYNNILAAMPVALKNAYSKLDS